MDLKLASSFNDTKAGLLALPVAEEDFRRGSLQLDRADKALRGLLRKTARAEGFTGKELQTFSMHSQGKLGSERVLLVGVGARAKTTLEALRRAAGAAAKAASKARAKTVAVALPGHAALADEVRAVAEGLLLGGYRYDKWRTQDEDKKGNVRAGIILSAELKQKNAAVDDAKKLGLELARAVNWARDLVNEPAMTLTPSALAEAATQACTDAGCAVEVWEKDKIEELKMGMFLGVAQGSAQAPKLIQVRYTPEDPEAAKKQPLAFVGKAITFDSGGLSLKPADAMVDMKTDMAGSAAVFAAMQVIAKVLRPKFPVHAFVGACENMPSGTSYRPGDVLRSRLGKTVEIANTDAEGRLVLGDVLSFACEEKPRGVIDLATLTGACVVALGHTTVGAFGDDEALMSGVLEAAKDAGEDFWRLPITPEVKENLKSDVADMKNSGTRWGGAISAAHFLKEFVGETPWVHLDIAGPSSSEKDRGYTPKGGTGVGVRTLVELVRRLDAPKL